VLEGRYSTINFHLYIKKFSFSSILIRQNLSLHTRLYCVQTCLFCFKMDMKLICALSVS